MYWLGWLLERIIVRDVEYVKYIIEVKIKGQGRTVDVFPVVSDDMLPSWSAAITVTGLK